jgi:hypothetical protein
VVDISSLIGGCIVFTDSTSSSIDKENICLKSNNVTSSTSHSSFGFPAQYYCLQAEVKGLGFYKATTTETVIQQYRFASWQTALSPPGQVCLIASAHCVSVVVQRTHAEAGTNP